MLLTGTRAHLYGDGANAEGNSPPPPLTRCNATEPRPPPPLPLLEAQAVLPAPDPPTKSDIKNDPCFGWGAFGSSHELVHYKYVAAAAASLLKESFERYSALLYFSQLRLMLLSALGCHLRPAALCGSTCGIFRLRLRYRSKS